ncbi:MAG: STAS domain-containing protein [Phycisphaerae bacterium]|nr:STAS domain-containing protein [Phycisphaerae bacterium]NUQ45371.1 STAS domain-containing protein [Phycisphaerae bacterium]
MSTEPSGPVRSISRVGSATVAELMGEIDMRCAPELREAMSRIVAERPKVLALNMGGVNYIDSTGLGTLVYVLRQVGGYRGRMALFGLSPTVRGAFEITKLLSVFEIRETLEEIAK